MILTLELELTPIFEIRSSPSAVSPFQLKEIVVASDRERPPFPAIASSIVTRTSGRQRCLAHLVQVSVSTLTVCKQLKSNFNYSDLCTVVYLGFAIGDYKEGKYLSEGEDREKDRSKATNKCRSISLLQKKCFKLMLFELHHMCELISPPSHVPFLSPSCIWLSP